MSIRSTKTYYNLPFAGLAGILLDEKTMKKVAKLIYRQNQELKELLTANIDSIEISNWTLAYPNGKQEAIYYLHQYNWESKEGRIALTDRLSQIHKVEHVYKGTREESTDEHMKLYDESTEVPI